jgi:hypothetical protein
MPETGHGRHPPEWELLLQAQPVHEPADAGALAGKAMVSGQASVESGTSVWLGPARYSAIGLQARYLPRILPTA